MTTILIPNTSHIHVLPIDRTIIKFKFNLDVFLLSSAAAGDNTYRTHCSISCLSQHYDKYVIRSGNSGRFMNNLSQLLI